MGFKENINKKQELKINDELRKELMEANGLDTIIDKYWVYVYSSNNFKNKILQGEFNFKDIKLNNEEVIENKEVIIITDNKRKNFISIFIEDFERNKYIVNSVNSYEDLSPKLITIFNGVKKLKNITYYKKYIDPLIYDFYIRNKIGYLNLHVQTKDEILLNDLNFINEIIGVVKSYSENTGILLNTDSLKIKTTLQSPGTILLFSVSYELIFIIGLIIYLIKGGKLVINKKEGFKMESESILKSISEFLDRRCDRKTQESIRKKLDKLKINSPEDIDNLMKNNKTKRKSY